MPIFFSQLRPALIALVIGAVATFAGAFWFHRTLQSAWARGYQSGQVEMAKHQQDLIERNRAAARAAAAISDQKIIELEQHSEQLQKKLTDLASAINKSAISNTACLGPDILRALSRTGKGGSDAGASTR